MVDIEKWLEDFNYAIFKKFHGRIVFVGLQGSYARCEATSRSNIDVVVIFDKLSMQDLLDYDEIVSKLQYREKLSGVIAGKDEIMNWEKSDLFQFYFDTKPIFGDLKDFLPDFDMKNIEQSIHLEACQIYQSCIHNILHDKDKKVLKDLYKSASFVLQALYYYQNHQYMSNLSDLVLVLEGENKVILDAYIQMKANDRLIDKTYHQLSKQLLNWSSQLIRGVL